MRLLRSTRVSELTAESVLRAVSYLFKRHVSHGQDEPGSNRALRDLWRIHEVLQLELHERRARAGTIFAVAVGILFSLIAAGLTGTFRDVSQASPVATPAYLAVIAYSMFAGVVAFIGLSPGLPWEAERSLEGAVWRLTRVLGAGLSPLAAARFRAVYEGPLGYRHYVSHAANDESPLVTVDAVVNITEADIVLRIRGLALQIHQYRLWRRFVSVIVAVQFLVVASGTVAVLAVRLEASAFELSLGVVAALALIYVVHKAASVGMRRIDLP